jgi:hypothetical protein
MNLPSPQDFQDIKDAAKISWAARISKHLVFALLGLGTGFLLGGIIIRVLGFE